MKGDNGMKQCLKITVLIKSSDDCLHDFVRKYATKYALEGTAQSIDDRIHIIACGDKENMDMFLDALHKGTAKHRPESIELEPFFKEKDYRGVFRVIE